MGIGREVLEKFGLVSGFTCSEIWIYTKGPSHGFSVADVQNIIVLSHLKITRFEQPTAVDIRNGKYEHSVPTYTIHISERQISGKPSIVLHCNPLLSIFHGSKILFVCFGGVVSCDS